MTMHAIARHWLSLNWQYIGQSVRKLAFPLTFLWVFMLLLCATTSWGAKHILSLSPGSHAMGLCLFGWPASTHLGWPRNFSDRHQPRLCLGKKWDKKILCLDFLGLSSNCGSHPTPSPQLSSLYWVSWSYYLFCDSSGSLPCLSCLSSLEASFFASLSHLPFIGNGLDHYVFPTSCLLERYRRRGQFSVGIHGGLSLRERSSKLIVWLYRGSYHSSGWLNPELALC